MIDLAATSWSDIAPFVLIGFVAQLVDGMLGVAFGFFSTSLLALLGMPAATAVATVRTVESFTTGASGIAHALQRNVDWSLFARLVAPGLLGALLGVWLFAVIEPGIMRPLIWVYALTLGIYLLWRAPRHAQSFRRVRFAGPLGFIGGLVDAGGKGGWGPVVTTTLLAQGTDPRLAIGTANAAEFFITVTTLAIAIDVLGASSVSSAALGLLLGAGPGAAIGAWLTRRISPSLLMRMVGMIVIAVGVVALATLMLSGTAAPVSH